MQEPWRYISALDLIDHWQVLIAGVLGFAAAILAVRFTLLSERRRRKDDLDALRRSLGVEVRQLVVAARGAHLAFRRMAQNRGVLISAQMVENFGYLPDPIIYRATADKIGLLGLEAMDVVTIYLQAEIVRGGIARFLRHRTPHEIPHVLIAGLAHHLMTLCKTALAVLPRLKTNVAEIDGRDGALFDLITIDASQWDSARQEWPDISA